MPCALSNIDVPHVDGERIPYAEKQAPSAVATFAQDSKSTRNTACSVVVSRHDPRVLADSLAFTDPTPHTTHHTPHTHTLT
jgi:hypothetical protein